MLALGFAEAERLHVSPYESIHIDLPAIAESGKVLDACIGAFLQELGGLKRSAKRQIRNVIQTAFGDAIKIAASRSESNISVVLALTPELPDLRVEIRGIWSVMLELPGVAGRESGESPYNNSPQSAGVGVERALIEHLVDDVQYRAEPGNNQWSLTKHLPNPLASGKLLAEPYTVHLNIPAMPQYLGVLQNGLTATLEQITGFSSDEPFVYALQLAAYETGVGIVEHACGGYQDRLQIALTFVPQASQFVVKIRDTGVYPFDIATLPDPTAFSPFSERFHNIPEFFASALPVTGGLYLLNLLLSRWLGPVAFADFSLVLALMLVVSFLVLGLQYTVAQFAKLYIAWRERKRIVGLRIWADQVAWGIGIAAGIGILAFAPLGVQLFDMSFIPYILLAISVPFTVSSGVQRGFLQAKAQTGDLALSYNVELWGKWLLVLLLVPLGGTVDGAVLGSVLPLGLSWWTAWRGNYSYRRTGKLAAEDRRAIIRLGLPVLGIEIGQILLNVVDIFLVRYFFAPELAGQYAALVLTGRAMFFFIWIAGSFLFAYYLHQKKESLSHNHRLLMSLALIGTMSAVTLLVARYAPQFAVTRLLNGQYLDLVQLVWPYTIVMILYALASTLWSYGLSVGYRGGGILTFLVAVIQIVGLLYFHSSLEQVIQVQMVVMVVFLVLLLAWVLGAKILNRKRVLV